MDLTGLREALAVRIALAIVNHHCVEAGIVRYFVEVVSDVPGAKEIENGDRQNGLDENFKRPTADQPRIKLGVLIEVKGK